MISYEATEGVEARQRTLYDTIANFEYARERLLARMHVDGPGDPSVVRALRINEDTVAKLRVKLAFAVSRAASMIGS